MGSRVELNDELKALLGTEDETGLATRVYFQPPESIKLTYPCYVYHRAGNAHLTADNGKYRMTPRYTLTYITYDPDDPLIQQTEEHFQLCRMTGASGSGGVNNYYYDLYY